MTPIKFSRSGVKDHGHSRYTLLLNLVNTIQTEPFQIGHTIKLSTHTTYDKRMTCTYWFSRLGFKGQGHTLHIALLINLENMIQTEPFQLGPSNLVNILQMTLPVGHLFTMLALLLLVNLKVFSWGCYTYMLYTIICKDQKSLENHSHQFQNIFVS